MPWLRKLGIVAALVPAVLAAAPNPARAALPPQGVYEACYPTRDPSGCAERLRLIGDAGFQAVINYWMLQGSSEGDLVTYADAARASGVKVLWPLNDLWTQDPQGTVLLSYYPKLASDCGCSTNQGLVDYIVRLAKDRPDTWGYYIADEPTAAQHDRLRAFAQHVRSLDPGHPVLVVACGVCAGAGADPTGANAAPFSDIDAVLGTDQYPVFTAPPDATTAGRWVGAGMRGVQAVADRAGRQTAIVLQSFSWGFAPTEALACGSSAANCRFPTRDEMSAQRDAALANGRPRLILWYALFDVIGTLPAQEPADWTPPADPGRRWQDLQAAAFAPEPGNPAAATPTAHPGAGGRLSADSVSYRIRGSRVVGRLRLTARFDDGSARVDLRSSRLNLPKGRRFFVRACITVAGATHCRSRWQRGHATAPHVSVRVPDGSADEAFSGRITVSARGRQGRLIRIAASHAT